MLKRITFLVFIVATIAACKSQFPESEKQPVLNSKFLEEVVYDTLFVNHTIDSLKALISKTSGARQVDLLNVFAEEWITINPKTTQLIAKDVLEYAQKTNNHRGVAAAKNNLGLYYYFVDLYDSAVINFNKTIQISEDFGLALPKAKALYGIANVYRFTGYPDKALDFFNQALAIYQEVVGNDRTSDQAKKGLAATLDKIGAVYTTKSDNEKALEYIHESLAINEEIGDLRPISYSLHSLAICYYYLGNIVKSLEYNYKSLEIRKKVGDRVGTASSLQNIGLIYSVQGDIASALDYFHQSLRIKEKIGDKRGAGYSYFHIGTVYSNQGDYTKALEYFEKAQKIRQELDDRNGMAYVNLHIGDIYLKRSEKQRVYSQFADSLFLYASKAVEHFTKSQSLFNETKDKFGLSSSYESLGRAYQILNDNKNAKKWYRKSLEIAEDIGDKNGKSKVLNLLGRIYLNDNDINHALDMATKSYELARDLGSPERIRDASSLLSDAYKRQNNLSQAFSYFRESIIMRDSLNNIINKELAEKRHWQTEYEKKAIADSLSHIQAIMVKDLMLAKKNEETKRQRFVIYAFVFFFFSLVVLTFFIYRNYRIKINANKIISEKNSMLEQAYEEIKATSDALAKQNEKLKMQNDEIENQKNSLANLAWELQDKTEEVEKQKNILTQQNKEITDSIVYAQRIQSAVLPSHEFIGDLFSEHYIIHKPKSIVSGDFYWATKIRDLVVFCVTDCTGHGVPGAFMSMMGVAFLNEIIRKEEVTNAAKVLDQLRQHVINSMEENHSEYVMFDGMDIGLCVLSTTTLELQFAGANIPCWIASGSIKNIEVGDKVEILGGLVELKPDRMPIGRYDRMDPFSYHAMKLKKNDIIYIASDGFADQFGGPEGKKFQKHKLIELIHEHCQKPLGEQKEILEREFDSWKGYTNQIDDVTILAIKV